MVRLWILCLVMVLAISEPAQAPVRPMMTLRLRNTAYSPKQPREGKINHKGKDIRNERGIAIPKELKHLIPDGAVVYLDDGECRVADDRYGRKGAEKFGGRCIDIRYYESIKSKPKTKAVNRELCKKFDRDWSEIKFYKR